MAFDHAYNSYSRRTLKWYFAAIKHDLFYGFLHKNTPDLADLGDPANGCNWTVRTTNLGPESIVYSAGVGRDISFEHALADRFGFEIILADPSPTGAETMMKPENQRPQFKFLKVALAGHDGDLILSPPPDAEEGSWIFDDKRPLTAAGIANKITVKCRTVESLMKQFGHSHIDLLKIDIEGAEYGVLDSVLHSKVLIRQIAVEFHNGVLPGIQTSLTIKMLLRMYIRGYRIVHKGGSNHTLSLTSEI
jgi:FkbM family methyltransferase